jgi:hypothetical protein
LETNESVLESLEAEWNDYIQSNEGALNEFFNSNAGELNEFFPELKDLLQSNEATGAEGDSEFGFTLDDLAGLLYEDLAEECAEVLDDMDR